MDDPTRRALARQILAVNDGVTSAVLLHRGGLAPADLVALVGGGVVQRLRRNVLVDAQRWASAPPWDRHALRARAVALGVPGVGMEPGRLALSHQSSLAVRSLAFYGVDDLAHGSRVRYGRGRRGGGLWVHSPVPEEQVELVDGVPCVSAGLAALQVAALSGAEAGLVAADSALRAEACTRADLAALVGLACLKNGRAAVRIVVDLADGRRESAGESRTAWLTHVLDIEVEAQVEIRDEHGILVARSDFKVKDADVLLEFDGQLKYTDRDALFAEKLREDRLRELGYEVVRITWEDLAHPHRVRAKIAAALARAQQRAA